MIRRSTQTSLLAWSIWLVVIIGCAPTPTPLPTVTPAPTAAPLPTTTPTPAVLPIPSELVGRWQLIHLVVDGQVRSPNPNDRYTVTITSDATEARLPLDLDQPAGLVEWHDGCNTRWSAFRATPSGEIRHIGEPGGTLIRCTLIDEETGKSIEDRGAEEMPFWPGDAVAYEIHDGELWLYTSHDEANALVFR